MIQRYFSGLRFGMLLQIAIGPMCLMVFNTAKNAGFWVAMSLVLAIALVDAFYIALASIGVSRIMEKESVKKIFKVVGALVLILFGLNIILGVFGVNLIPGLNLKPTSSSVFLQGLVLTLSNPLTIAFWGSVLTTKIIEEEFGKKELLVFSCGLVSATLSTFLSQSVANVLNVCVGALIMFFGLKMLLKKEKE